LRVANSVDARGVKLVDLMVGTLAQWMVEQWAARKASKTVEYLVDISAGQWVNLMVAWLVVHLAEYLASY
jgi:hypothetical protein